MRLLKILLLLAVVFLHQQCALTQTDSDENVKTRRYIIEGRIKSLDQANWESKTQIHVNRGEFIGFVQKAGSFVVHNVPSGSYVLEVLNPEYTFEPIRVEINSKGKFRARVAKLCVDRESEVGPYNPTQVKCKVPYPLRIKPVRKTNYFQPRDQWKIRDIILNPMVLMMVLPVVLLMVLPKLNDPETKKQMEEIQSGQNFDFWEKASNFLAGSQKGGDTQHKKTQKTKNRQ